MAWLVGDSGGADRHLFETHSDVNNQVQGAPSMATRGSEQLPVSKRIGRSHDLRYLVSKMLGRLDMRE
jgi:hypothetical protein